MIKNFINDVIKMIKTNTIGGIKIARNFIVSNLGGENGIK
jgi:hypothetical protein